MIFVPVREHDIRSLDSWLLDELGKGWVGARPQSAKVWVPMFNSPWFPFNKHLTTCFVLGFRAGPEAAKVTENRCLLPRAHGLILI